MSNRIYLLIALTGMIVQLVVLLIVSGVRQFNILEHTHYLINHYPFEFIKYYLLPNIKNYLFPVLETHAQGTLLLLLPGFFLVVNLYFMCCCIWLLVTGDIRKLPRSFVYVLWWVIGLLLVNFCFSIFATLVVLRYQVFPMIVCFTFSLLVTNFVSKIGKP